MNKAKLTAALAALFIVNILLIGFSQQAEAIAYKQGSSGSTVTKIQQTLKSAGYYTYTVDGIYGSRTTAAVKKFQRAKGLVVDGKPVDGDLVPLSDGPVCAVTLTI